MNTFKLALTTDSGHIVLVSVNPNEKLNCISEIIRESFGIPASEQQIYNYGNLLNSEQSMGSAGISNGDHLLIKSGATISLKAPDLTSRDFMGIPAVDPKDMYKYCGSRFPIVRQCRHGDHSDDERRNPWWMRIDPDSAEGQRRIEKMIRRENIRENMEAAMEHSPEAFGSVFMLYVDCKINNVSGIKAFVDSGSQVTIISKTCAERCGILHLLDKNYKGTARGVGTAKIFGRIHLALMSIGSEVFEISFQVMESVIGDHEIMIGLDTLRKYEGIIDLRANCLLIGNVSVPFLAEKDLPDSFPSDDDE